MECSRRVNDSARPIRAGAKCLAAISGDRIVAVYVSRKADSPAVESTLGAPAPRCHALENAIAENQGMGQGRTDVRKKSCEQCKREPGMQRSQCRIEPVAMRQDRGQVKRAYKHDRVTGRRQHAPPDHW